MPTIDVTNLAPLPEKTPYERQREEANTTKKTVSITTLPGRKLFGLIVECSADSDPQANMIPLLEALAAMPGFENVMTLKTGPLFPVPADVQDDESGQDMCTFWMTTQKRIDLRTPSLSQE